MLSHASRSFELHRMSHIDNGACVEFRQDEVIPPCFYISFQAATKNACSFVPHSSLRKQLTKRRSVISSNRFLGVGAGGAFRSKPLAGLRRGIRLM